MDGGGRRPQKDAFYRKVPAKDIGCKPKDDGICIAFNIMPLKTTPPQTPLYDLCPGCVEEAVLVWAREIEAARAVAERGTAPCGATTEECSDARTCGLAESVIDG